MLTTFITAVGCTLFLSGLAEPALPQTGCRELSEHASDTTPPPALVDDGLHLSVAGSHDRARANVFQAPGLAIGWGGEVSGKEVSAETDLATALLGDQLGRVVTDVSNHIDVKVRRQPSALLIAYVLKF